MDVFNKYKVVAKVNIKLKGMIALEERYAKICCVGLNSRSFLLPVIKLFER